MYDFRIFPHKWSRWKQIETTHTFELLLSMAIFSLKNYGMLKNLLWTFRIEQTYANNFYSRDW